MQVYEGIGKIKLFMSRQPVGFIKPDDGGPDVIFHTSLIARTGRMHAIVGDVYRFEAVKNEKGGRAIGLELIKESDDPTHKPRLLHSTKVDKLQPIGTVVGKLKIFNKARHYSIYESVAGDIFVHNSMFQRTGLTPRSSDEMQISYTQTEKGLAAIDMSPVS